MTFPVVLADVAFTTAPFAAPTWTAIAATDLSTTKLEAFNFRWGRQAALDTFAAGAGTMSLFNHDRAFDPLYAAGPYAGNLLPNKRVRLRATWAGTTYDLFYGYVNGWPQTYAPPSQSVASVPFSDGMKFLARNDLPPDPYKAEVLTDSPSGYWRMDESAGKTLADSSTNGTRAITIDTDTSLLKSGGLIVSSAGGVQLNGQATFSVPGSVMPSGTAAFTFEFWFQVAAGSLGGYEFMGTDLMSSGGGGFPTFALLAGSSWTFTIADDPILGTNYRQVVSTTATNDGKPHHLAFVRSGSLISIYVDGVDASGARYGTGNPSMPIGFPLNVNRNGAKLWGANPPVIDEMVMYPTALSAARIAAHYNAGAKPWKGDRTGARVTRVLDLATWPAADRNIDTGQSTLGAASWGANTKQLDYLKKVATSEQGALFVDHRDGGKMRFRDRATTMIGTLATVSQATFSDDSADNTATRYDDLELIYDEQLIINTVNVSWVGGTVTVTDAASITTNGPLSKNIDTLVPTRTEAVNLGNWILAHYKTVFARVKSIKIDAAARNGNAAALTWPQVLGRRVGDRVTVVRQPQGLGTAISLDVLIEGIEHDVANGLNRWQTKFWCSPADIAAGYWVLNTSLLNTGTQLAY